MIHPCVWDNNEYPERQVIPVDIKIFTDNNTNISHKNTKKI